MCWTRTILARGFTSQCTIGYPGYPEATYRKGPPLAPPANVGTPGR